MYSYFYRFLQRLIVKRTFNEDLIKLIDKNKVNEIIDIGCADSSILEYTKRRRCLKKGGR